MSNFLNINIPYFCAYLDSSFCYNQPPNIKAERLPIEVFSFTSIPQRCGLFSVMTEYGSQHARVPIHYLHSKKESGSNYPLDWIQLWDTLSYYASVNIVDYLKNRSVNILLKNKKKHKAKYMFTIDWSLGQQYYGGYGEMAAGHKCGHFLEGEDGQYFLQPNNRLFWMDGGSFIAKKFDKKPDWKVFSQEFSCENTGSRWTSESEEELFFYDFKEDNQ